MDKNMWTRELEQAKTLLKNCIVEGGFAAAIEERDNYRHVWSRDGCVCGLASLSLGDEQLIETFRANLRTLAKHQGKNGEIPSNVSLPKNRVSYGTTVGRVDAAIWFIIGVCSFGRMTGSDELVVELWDNMERAHHILNAWEFNQGGLVYVPFSGDWADEYILSGYLLYDQVLRLWAMYELSAAARRVGKDNQLFVEKGQQIEKLLNERYLPTEDRPYFLAGYNPGETHQQFDALGNALCCLLGIGSESDRLKSLEYAIQNSSFDLVPAFYPVIELDDPRYQALISAAKAVKKTEPRNKPGQYHNGGLWPFVNGFWVLAAKKLGNEAVAERWTKGIAEVNALNNHAFSEFRDSRTGEAGGTKGMAWSAAGFILAQAEPLLIPD